MTRRQRADEEFSRFVYAAYPGLVRFGALLTGDRAGGEDVMQTALMKLYRSWPRLEDEAAAGAYTRRIMVRLAQRGRRRRWTGVLRYLDTYTEMETADALGIPVGRSRAGQREVWPACARWGCSTRTS